ncbi:hypothetical protein J7I98_30000 [Streptomyces sp. ISL-98]|uniref:hypothetical protein n=1 Tax=Streptomyces sp. ISL-98 TaxID=2819192 RepID=UPI001BE86DAC|nr:hypothetical protein [Streptomyces sp. ISL-98]MBT2510021.1 hypothetical protein [Streptomyces sp. ISL-98]
MGLHISWGKCPHSPPEPPPPALRWHDPGPFGLTPARQSMSGGAGALLAGFSTALVGVIAQAPDKIRYSGWALLLLTLAAMAFVACVQCGFNARARMYSHAEITEWRPLPWTEDEAQSLHNDQEVEAKTGRRWEQAAEWTYHFGIILLAAGIALVLIPMGDSQENQPRWVAAYATMAGGFVKFLTYIIGWCKDRK